MNVADQQTLDDPAPGGSAAQALAEYLTRVDAGETVDRQQFLASYAPFARELATYFDVADKLDQAHAALQQTVDRYDQRTLDAQQTLDAVDSDASIAIRLAEQQPIRTDATPFGDYDLIEMIARGGMGVVYKARQRRLNRIVAVKMILAGQFADKLDVERFYAEAEAAANLRHPNIVGIHEVGQCEGQHFFSMDYIAGESLADKVRDNPLTPEEAARYVKTVAEAMQFAHDQGILHRDLKPANVLVDGDGHPFITDFGLSKRVDGASQLTMTGGVVGTPSYMPPEQAAGRSDEVGVASDVYALGAVLYQLTTGSPPFRSANVAQTIQLVLHSEPVSPRTLNPGIPRDLETICLKCLQKEPDRRYGSARVLAEELECFLDGRPIKARPLGPVARAWRLCRRNPVVASLSAAAVALLVVLLAVSASYNIRLTAAKNESDEFLRQAEAAVDDLFVEASENTLLNEPGMLPVRERLLRRALVYYERFLQQRSNDPSIQDQLARTHFRVGVITEAIESRENAVASYQQARRLQQKLVEQSPGNGPRLLALGNTINALANAQQRLRRFSAARRNYNDAIAIRRRLVQLSPDEAEPQRMLANSYMNLGLLEQELGDAEQARQQYITAQDLRQDYLDRGGKDRKTLSDLGKGHYNLAVLAQASEDLETARAEFNNAAEKFADIYRAAPGDLDNRYWLAVCYTLLGDLEPDIEGALVQYNTARDHLEPLARNNANVADYQRELAALHLNLGEIYRETGKRENALPAFERARDVLQGLVAKDSQTPSYRRDLAITLHELAVEEATAGRATEARFHLQASRAYLQELVAQHSDVADFRIELEATEATLAGLDANMPPSPQIPQDR